MTGLISLEYIYNCILYISSVGIIISGIEWIYLSKSFKDQELFSWKVRKTRNKNLLGKKIFNVIYTYPNILFLILCQVLCAILLLFFINDNAIKIACCIIISVISITLSLRSYVGYTGADQVMKLTFTASTLCFISNTNFALSLGLTFISVQLIIAYATPGLLRLFEKEWKNGNDLLLICRLHTYGQAAVWRFLETNKKFSKLISWSIMCFECCAPLVIFLPVKYVILYLVFGVFFHTGNAIVMGLNTFPWAFIGTYPAYLWLSYCINKNLY